MKMFWYKITTWIQIKYQVYRNRKSDPFIYK